MSRSWKNITVIVADDHGEIREVVREYLNRLPGVRVIGEARNGFEVVSEVERLRPDLVVMDVGLPRRSGVEATRIIKRRFSTTKVFLATLFEESLYKQEALRVEADGLISKSHFKQSLEALVRTMHHRTHL